RWRAGSSMRSRALAANAGPDLRMEVSSLALVLQLASASATSFAEHRTTMTARSRSELILGLLVGVDNVAGLVLLRPHDGHHRKVLERLQVVVLNVLVLHGDNERLGQLAVGANMHGLARVLAGACLRGKPKMLCCHVAPSTDVVALIAVHASTHTLGIRGGILHHRM